MRLTLRGIAGAFAGAVVLETAVFAVYYDDLLYLRRPVTRIISAPAETFVHHASTALKRPKVTVDHLETIADAARALGMHDVELRALERRIASDPSDRALHLRLADGYRRAGRYAEAEGIYLELLDERDEAVR